MLPQTQHQCSDKSRNEAKCKKTCTPRATQSRKDKLTSAISRGMVIPSGMVGVNANECFRVFLSGQRHGPTFAMRSCSSLAAGALGSKRLAFLWSCAHTGSNIGKGRGSASVGRPLLCSNAQQHCCAHMSILPSSAFLLFISQCHSIVKFSTYLDLVRRMPRANPSASCYQVYVKQAS